MRQRSDPRAVLDFWFGPPAADAAALRQKVDRWYRGGKALDAEIDEKFRATVDAALAGELDVWASEPRGRLALVLVLDQFPRSIHRDTPLAFAGDPTAQRLVIEALDAGLDRDLHFEERMFLIMPLLHAEHVALQERAVVEMQRLHDEAPAELRPVYGMGLEQARKYRGIISSFGRFPHRNQVLGRQSTPEELALLESWAQKAPPAAMQAQPDRDRS
jgi:uncharacterized protein (DUF924 family)